MGLEQPQVYKPTPQTVDDTHTALSNYLNFLNVPTYQKLPIIDAALGKGDTQAAADAIEKMITTPDIKLSITNLLLGEKNIGWYPHAYYLDIANKPIQQRSVDEMADLSKYETDLGMIVRSNRGIAGEAGAMDATLGTAGNIFNPIANVIERATGKELMGRGDNKSPVTRIAELNAVKDKSFLGISKFLKGDVLGGLVEAGKFLEDVGVTIGQFEAMAVGGGTVAGLTKGVPVVGRVLGSVLPKLGSEAPQLGKLMANMEVFEQIGNKIRNPDAEFSSVRVGMSAISGYGIGKIAKVNDLTSALFSKWNFDKGFLSNLFTSPNFISSAVKFGTRTSGQALGFEIEGLLKQAQSLSGKPDPETGKPMTYWEAFEKVWEGVDFKEDILKSLFVMGAFNGVAVKSGLDTRIKWNEIERELSQTNPELLAQLKQNAGVSSISDLVTKSQPVTPGLDLSTGLPPLGASEVPNPKIMLGSNDPTPTKITTPEVPETGVYIPKDTETPDILAGIKDLKGNPVFTSDQIANMRPQTRLFFATGGRDGLPPSRGENEITMGMGLGQLFTVGKDWFKTDKDENGDTKITPVFYSSLEKAIEKKLPEKFTGEQAKGLLNSLGLNKEEKEITGVEDWLNQHLKATKQELLDHVRSNQITYTEKILTEDLYREDNSELNFHSGMLLDAGWTYDINPDHVAFINRNERDPNLRGELYSAGELPKNLIYHASFIEDYLSKRAGQAAKYGAWGDHELVIDPKGEAQNYKERLITIDELKDQESYIEYIILPSKSHLPPDPYIKSEDRKMYIVEGFVQGKVVERHGLSRDKLDRFLVDRGADSHDIDNIIKDRTFVADSRPQEFVGGHFFDITKNELAHSRETDRSFSIPGKIGSIAARFIEELQSDWHKYLRSGKDVPDAPLKGKWHELVLKRVLSATIEDGKQHLVWASGTEIKNRYSLDSLADTILYNKSTGQLTVFRNGEERLLIKISPEKLTSYVSKEQASKLIEFGKIQGKDLEIGGKWAEHLYDETIPNFFKDYLKKFGVKIQDYEYNGKKFKGFEITDAIREGLSKGQPLYGQNLSFGAGIGQAFEGLFKKPEESSDPKDYFEIYEKIKSYAPQQEKDAKDVDIKFSDHYLVEKSTKGLSKFARNVLTTPQWVGIFHPEAKPVWDAVNGSLRSNHYIERQIWEQFHNAADWDVKGEDPKAVAKVIGLVQEARMEMKKKTATPKAGPALEAYLAGTGSRKAGQETEISTSELKGSPTDEILKNQYRLTDNQVYLYRGIEAAINEASDVKKESNRKYLLSAFIKTDPKSFADVAKPYSDIIDKMKEDGFKFPDNDRPNSQALTELASRIIEDRFQDASGYFPMVRLGGSYAVRAESKDGKLLGWNTYESTADAKKAIPSFQKEFPGADVRHYERKEFIRNYSNKLNLYELESLIQETGADAKDPQIEILRNSLANRTVERYSIPRRLVPGIDWTPSFVIDALDQFIGMTARNATRFEGVSKAKEALKDIKDAQLYSYMDNYIEYWRRSSGLDFAQIRSAISMYYLGAKMSFPLVNFLQRFTSTYPTLKRYVDQFGVKGISSEKLFFDAQKKEIQYDTYRAMLRTGKDYDPGLDPALFEGLERATKEGIVGSPLADYVLGRDKFSTRNAVRASEKLTRVAGFGAQITEKSNRVHAFISMWDLCERANVPEDLRYKMAADFIDETQGSYGVHNIPQFIAQSGSMKPILRAAYIFKHYGINYHNLLVKNFMYGVESGNYGSASRMLATMVLTAGVTGASGYQLYRMLHKQFFGDEPEVQLREMFTKQGIPITLQNIILRGAGTAAGIDLSYQAGTGDFIPTRIDLTTLFGAPGGIYDNVVSANRLARQGDWEKAAIQLAPTFIRQAATAVKAAQEGGYVTSNGNMIYKPDKLAIVLMALAFTPTDLGLERLKVQAEKLYQTSKIEASTLFNDRFVNALATGDKDELVDIIDDINNYNRNQSKKGLKGWDFNSSYKSILKQLAARKSLNARLGSLPKDVAAKSQQLEQIFRGQAPQGAQQEEVPNEQP